MIEGVYENASLYVDGKKGRWVCRVDLGRDRVTGRRVRPSRSWPLDLDPEEVRRQAVEWANTLRPAPDATPDLPDMLAAYVEWRAAMGAPANTLSAYRGSVKRIARVCPGRLRFTDVGPREARSIVAAVMARGGEGGEPVGPRTANAARALLVLAYGQWVRDGLMQSNPFRDVPACSVLQPSRARTLTADEVAALTAACAGVWERRESEPYYLVLASRAVLLALASGLRIGELLALRPGDVTGGEVRVHATVSQHAGPGNGVQERPKTRAGERSVPISPADSDMLAAWLKWSDATVKPGKGNARRIFCGPDGRHATHWVMGEYFHKLTAAAGIDGGVTFHMLRHTFASHLLAGGVNPKTVQELLGHADVSTTLAAYGHLLPGSKRDAADWWAGARARGTVRPTESV